MFAKLASSFKTEIMESEKFPSKFFIGVSFINGLFFAFHTIYRWYEWYSGDTASSGKDILYSLLLHFAICVAIELLFAARELKPNCCIFKCLQIPYRFPALPVNTAKELLKLQNSKHLTELTEDSPLFNDIKSFVACNWTKSDSDANKETVIPNLVVTHAFKVITDQSKASKRFNSFKEPEPDVESGEHLLTWQTTKYSSDVTGGMEPLTNSPTEARLFHGTCISNINSIARKGFKLSYSNPKCSSGSALYFGESSAMANVYAERARSSNDKMFLTMVVARVKVGSVKGCDGKKCSVVKGKAGYRQVAVFEEARCFPEFVVVYQLQ